MEAGGVTAPEPAPDPNVRQATETSDLLAPSKDAEAATPRPRRVIPREEQARRDADAAVRAAEREAAALDRALRQRYRPASNPARALFTARGLYSLAGNLDGATSGRLGGLAVDAGVAWNQIGAAMSLTALGGQLQLENLRETRALIGGGPTISLGRLAMVRRGFLDLRLGYDFLYAGVRPRESTSEEVEGPIDDSDLVPHGPRIRLDMGLLAHPEVPRRVFHGGGFTIGYQLLVGSLRGDLPPTNVLSIGLLYWLG
jgi:hypothetical protein